MHATERLSEWPVEWIENLTATHIAGTIPHDNPVVFIGE